MWDRARWTYLAWRKEGWETALADSITQSVKSECSAAKVTTAWVYGSSTSDANTLLCFTMTFRSMAEKYDKIL